MARRRVQHAMSRNASRLCREVLVSLAVLNGYACGMQYRALKWRVAQTWTQRGSRSQGAWICLVAFASMRYAMSGSDACDAPIPGGARAIFIRDPDYNVIEYNQPGTEWWLEQK
eukprot:1906698-Rhodomonas_salina.2